MKQTTKFSYYIIWLFLFWLAYAILLLIFSFKTKSDIPTFTSFDSIRINTIPVYRDCNQAYYDEELPEGALYIISSEDFIRIKKNNR